MTFNMLYLLDIVFARIYTLLFITLTHFTLLRIGKDVDKLYTGIYIVFTHTIHLLRANRSSSLH